MVLPDRTEDQSLMPIESVESEVKEQPVKRSKAEELLQKIYSTSVPEPVFDQAKADRLKRMGRVNQMGKGISVLGDILSSGLGANVNRRQDDGTAARLYQSFENNLDKYKNDQDVFSLRKMSKSLEDAKLGLNEERRAEQLELANKKQADWMKAKEVDRAINYAKWSADYNRKLAADKVNADYKNKNAESNRIRANKTGSKSGEPKPFDPIQVKDKNGNNVKLEQGDWDNLYQDAMKDPKFLKEFFPALKSQFEAVPDVLLKQTARAFYDYKKNNDYSASQKEAEDRVRKERGLSTGPVNVSGTTQKAKPAIDYTKIVY